MGSKGVNLGSKISNSRSVDFFRFFRIFSDFFEFFFEKVVFFQAFRPNFRPDGLILETRKPQNKIFQTQKRGYAKFKENRQSRFGHYQKLLFLYKTGILPLQKWIHTHRKGGYEISSYASLRSAKEISHYLAFSAVLLKLW